MATLLDKPRAQAALDAWATYGTMEAAAAAAGVHRSTIYRWAERGRRPGARAFYRRFARRFDGRHIALLGNGVRLSQAEYDRGMRDAMAELDRQYDELLGGLE
jgi:DNA-binding MurR/RpiR family transcriptional regulator